MTKISGLEVIGYFCWWSLNEVKIHRDELQKVIDSLGISFKIPAPKSRSAFLKAVREVKAQHTNKGLLIRKIKKTADTYMFGLVDERVEKASDHLRYSHRATMDFNPITGALNCDSPHKAFELIKELFEEYQYYLNADDVRVLMLKLLNKTMSISVRQNGGIYFIHAKFEEMVEKLESMLKQIPGKNEFLTAPQIDAEKSRRAIYKSFVESLKYRLAEFEKDLGKDGLIRPTALNARVKQFKEMRKEIEFYRDALQFQVTDLSDSLTSLEQKVVEKLKNG